VPFTFDVQEMQKLSTIQKKQTTQNTAQQNYPGSVTSEIIVVGNEDIAMIHTLVTFYYSMLSYS